MMHPLPYVSHAYRLVAQKENHRDISHISIQTETTAFDANKKFQRSSFVSSGALKQCQGNNEIMISRRHRSLAPIISALIVKFNPTMLIVVSKSIVIHQILKGSKK